MKYQRLLSLAAIGFVLASSGCTVGPDYAQPEVEKVPDAWNAAATKGLAEGESSIQTWWTVFEDPTLTSLIERSRTSNLTLREAMWRVEEWSVENASWSGNPFDVIAHNRKPIGFKLLQPNFVRCYKDGNTVDEGAACF